MIEVRLLAGKIVSAKDAKICIEEHEKLLAQLEDISKRENESVEAIVKASDDLMNGEINKILKNLSVDELNRRLKIPGIIQFMIFLIHPHLVCHVLTE